MLCLCGFELYSRWVPLGMKSSLCQTHDLGNLCSQKEKKRLEWVLVSRYDKELDQPKQAPFWILCWHVSMKGRSIIQIQASRRQILSNISSLIRAEYWKSQPRKLCEFCKCWITDNKPVTYKASVFPAPEKFN